MGSLLIKKARNKFANISSTKHKLIQPCRDKNKEIKPAEKLQLRFYDIRDREKLLILKITIIIEIAVFTH